MSHPPVLAAVGLGGNQGDAEATLRAAIRELAQLPDTRLLQASGLYRTPAWGKRDQADFVNAAAMLETALPADGLLDALLAIERRHGRDRGRGERWGPRTLDLDLLLYGDQQIDQPGLLVPHPHLHERPFVLVPLAAIAPDAMVPGRDHVSALLAAVDAGDCVLLGD